MATFRLTWTPVNDASSVGQLIEYKVASDSAWTIYATIGPALDTYDLELANGVQYNFRVTSQCVYGGSFPSTPTQAMAPPCTPITVEFDVIAGSTNQTADVTVIPSGGVAPYTYLWSTGETTDTATGLQRGGTYTVEVKDANKCSVTETIIPNVAVLTGLTIEVMYFANNTNVVTDPFYDATVGGRRCTGGHTCNAAKFNLIANNIVQGVANMNNNGGSDPVNSDDHNTPPGGYASPSAEDRYFRKDISGTDAAAIAGPDGTVFIELDYIGTAQYLPLGVRNPHDSAVWLRITRLGGIQLLSTCLNAFSGYTFDPYSI